MKVFGLKIMRSFATSAYFTLNDAACGGTRVQPFRDTLKPLVGRGVPAPAVLPLIGLMFMLVMSVSAGITWEPLYEPGCGGAIVTLGISPHNPDHLVGGGDMLGTCVSFDGGESWSIGKGLPSYEMAAVTFHPTDDNIVWMGSCMGPMKSTDGGRTWQWKRKGMPDPSHSHYTCKIEKVLFDPANVEHLFAFGGSHRAMGAGRDGYGDIYESNDSGETWELKKTLMKDGKRENITEVQFSPDGQLEIVTDLSGWIGHETPGHATHLTFHPQNAKTIWITVASSTDDSGVMIPGTICKSVDGGETWKQSDSGIIKNTHSNQAVATKFSQVVVSPSAPDDLYVCDRGWGTQTIWKSADGGDSWTKVCDNKVVRACPAGLSLDMVAHPTRKGEIWGWGTEFYLRTKDGGKTWTDQSSVQPDPDGRPDFWRGRGWNGWCSKNVVFDQYHKGRSILLMMDAGHGWLSEDGLNTWRYTKSNANAWNGGNYASFTKDGHIYIATGQRVNNAGVIISSDDGKTFTAVSGEECGLIARNKGTYGCIYALPDDGRRAWVHTAGTLRYTVDGGSNWRIVDGLGKVSGFAADPTKEGRMYVVSDGRLFVTDNGVDVRDLGVAGVPSGCMVCDGSGRILVSEEKDRTKAGLYRYDPADGSFTRILERRLIGAIATDPFNPKHILVGLQDYPYHDFAGGQGVLFSIDDGKNWQVENSGLPNMRVTAAAFDPFDRNIVIIGTAGTGFFRGRIDK